MTSLAGEPTSIVAALWLSLRVATAATLITLLVAVPLAYQMARHKRFTGKSLLEGLILLPLVLPPTVVGYLIILTLGARGWPGAWLSKHFDYTILFRFEGAVLAAAIVALPMMYMPAKAAFATVERELEDIARTLGASRLQVFWHVSIPLARIGLFSGILLAFARALGEFGATIMVFGWQPNRETLPILIYADFERGEMTHAIVPVVALTLLSLAVTIAFNIASAKKE